MEPVMEEQDKRMIAVFIAYRRTSDGYEFYLQKRTQSAPTNPGLFSVFGGGIEENETPEQALLREVAEELAYTPEHAVLFSTYETAKRLGWIFVEEVGEDFESKVNVQEGEYGAFRSQAQIQNAPDTAFFAQLVIHDICSYFLKI
jgi:8-oxo-dGTP pyrophosphatase MutT (NUDIX family)